MPVRVFWKDKNLVYLGCNTLFARDAGFADPKDIIGKDDFQMGWRDQAELYRSDDRQVIESGCSKILIEESQTTPDGKTITLLSSKVPLRNSEEEIQGVLGTYMDITERKSAETVTRKLLAIVETSPDFIGFSSLEGSVEYLNPEGRKMVGLDQEKSVSSTMILDFVHETDRERFQNQVVPALFRDGHWDGETLFKNFRTGAAIPMWQRVFFITDPGTVKREKITTIARDITESKKAEASLQLQGRALEAAANAIVITDSKGVIKWANPAFTTYTGYSAAEVIGQTPSVLKSGKHDDKFYRNLWETVIAGKVWHGEMTNRRKDGTLYYEDMTITPMRDINGRIAHFIAVKQDITMRKASEEQLLWKTAFLEAQINSSLDGILIVDSEGRKVHQNKRMADLWNIPRDIADEADDQRQREWVISQVKNSQQFAEQIAVLDAHPDEISHSEVELNDGRIIDRYSAPVLGTDRKRYGRIRTYRDITVRKREEANLRRFATVVRDSNDAITIQDFDGRITTWNHGAELMYGYGEEEALLMNIERLTASDKVAEQKEFIRRLIAGEAITSFETLRVTKDGRVLNVWMTVTKLLDEAGNPIGLASTERDITERKRAEEQIAEQASFLDKARDAIIVRDLEGNFFIGTREPSTSMVGRARKPLAGMLSKFSVPIQNNLKNSTD